MGLLDNLETIKNILGDKKEVKIAEDTADLKGSFYDFTVNSLDGKSINFKNFKGKKIVVINVASKCGYTPQYEDWQTFHEKYGEKIIVLGFPANNFLSQESGTNGEIAAFCQKNYGVTFQMFEKLDVIGDSQHPLFKWLSSKDLNGWNDQAPTWNFCKYIINEKGKLTHFLASKITPESKEFKQAIGII
jgi:glutathione peroxidase